MIFSARSPSLQARSLSIHPSKIANCIRLKQWWTIILNDRLNMHSPPWVGNEIALGASLMLGTNIQPVSSPATIYSWADLGLAGTVEEGWGCA